MTRLQHVLRVGHHLVSSTTPNLSIVETFYSFQQDQSWLWTWKSRQCQIVMKVSSCLFSISAFSVREAVLVLRQAPVHNHSFIQQIVGECQARTTSSQKVATLMALTLLWGRQILNTNMQYNFRLWQLLFRNTNQRKGLEREVVERVLIWNAVVVDGLSEEVEEMNIWVEKWNEAWEGAMQGSGRGFQMKWQMQIPGRGKSLMFLRRRRRSMWLEENEWKRI